jgi:hypothetical protein
MRYALGIGPTEKSMPTSLQQDREAHVFSRWGDPVKTIDRGQLADRCAVTVHEATAPDGKPFQALITQGLSDEQVVEGFPRTEFVWYVRELEPVHIDWLSFAAVVHTGDRVYPGSMTMPMLPCPPAIAGSDLTCVMFMPPIISRDRELLTSGGVEVEWLWLVPLTERERTHLKSFPNRGESRTELLRLFQENQHPWIFESSRPSYI